MDEPDKAQLLRILLTDVLKLPFAFTPSEEPALLPFLRQHCGLVVQIKKLRDVVGFLEGRLKDEVLRDLKKGNEIQKNPFREKLAACMCQENEYKMLHLLSFLFSFRLVTMWK